MALSNKENKATKRREHARASGRLPGPNRYRALAGLSGTERRLGVQGGGGSGFRAARRHGTQRPDRRALMLASHELFVCRNNTINVDF